MQNYLIIFLSSNLKQFLIVVHAYPNFLYSTNLRYQFRKQNHSYWYLITTLDLESTSSSRKIRRFKKIIIDLIILILFAQLWQTLINLQREHAQIWIIFLPVPLQFQSSSHVSINETNCRLYSSKLQSFGNSNFLTKLSTEIPF